METARDVLASIRRKQKEREYLLAVLDLWAQVAETGYRYRSGGVVWLRQPGSDAEERAEISIGGSASTLSGCRPARHDPAFTTTFGITTAV